MLGFFVWNRNAYNLVLNKRGDLIYQGVGDNVRKHLNASAKEIVSAPDEILLSTIRSIWVDHKITMNMVKDILMYMDKVYCTQHKKSNVYNMAILIFREVILL